MYINVYNLNKEVKMPKVRLGISISDKLKKQIDKQAKVENRPTTSLVALIVERFVANKTKKKKRITCNKKEL